MWYQVTDIFVIKTTNCIFFFKNYTKLEITNYPSGYADNLQFMRHARAHVPNFVYSNSTNTGIPGSESAANSSFESTTTVIPFGNSKTLDKKVLNSTTAAASSNGLEKKKKR